MSDVINYNKVLMKTLQLIEKNDIKPALLLHVCCAPCAVYPLRLLSRYFKITIIFFNPNIYPESEFELRLSNLVSYVYQIKNVQKNNGMHIDFVGEYLAFNGGLAKDFITKVGPYADEPEGGERCLNCVTYRLNTVMQFAREHDFPYVITTLTSGNRKNVNMINSTGLALEKKYPGVTYLVSDFKKDDGELKGIEICKRYNIYRQRYCGCLFSLQNSLKN